MAKKAWVNRQQRKAKFASRAYNRCKITGRRRAFMRKFGVSRLQFREMALSAEIPGVTKSSW